MLLNDTKNARQKKSRLKMGRQINCIHENMVFFFKLLFILRRVRKTLYDRSDLPVYFWMVHNQLIFLRYTERYEKT